MSCDDCDKAQNEAPAFYYRIENANVQVKGCERHVKTMFDRLRSYGVRKEEQEPLVSGNNTNPA
jgi:hypothetical protein